MKDFNGKDRLLKLRQIFLEETDEAHELAIEEIITKLRGAFGPDFKVEKKAIKDDIDTLNRSEFEIIENAGKYGKKYYSHQARKFELFELRLFIDAILSARFITKQDSEKLISKIKQLTSIHLAKDLPSQIFYDQSVKGNYQPIKREIDRLHAAISSNRKVQFQYGKYNVDKDFVLSRGGALYHVAPYALVWHNDFYYLIGMYEAESEFRHYRVDRMRQVSVTDQPVVKVPMNVSEYLNKTFHMYAGNEDRVKIRFRNSLINVVIDRFGLEADIEKMDEDHFLLRTKAAVSDGLVRWILTWGSDAKVLAPTALSDFVKREAKNMLAQYE